MRPLILIVFAIFSLTTACIYVDESVEDGHSWGDSNGEFDGSCGPECAECDDGFCELLEPPGSDCQSDSDCFESDLCLGGECIFCPNTCDQGCFEGERCSFDNFCIPGDRCRGNLDCASNEICSQNGYCTEPDVSVDPDPDHTDDPDCPECKTPTCGSDSDCSQGDICVNGGCLDTCAVDSDCGTGQVCDVDLCDVGVCVTDPNGGNECLYNTDCENAVCENGYCIDRCDSDAECAAGEWCDAGSCRPDTRPQPECRNNAECGVGEVCSDAKCRTYCTCDEDCGSSDSGLVCDAGACVQSEDASPECVLAAHCGDGENCIDGQCL